MQVSFVHISRSIQPTCFIAVPSDGECDGTTVTSEREKTAGKFQHIFRCTQLICLIAVASTTVRLRRSGAHKSYTPDHESEPAESSDSDSDWATAEEKRKEAERAADPARPFRLSANGKQKGPAAAADHGDDAEGCDEEDTSEDEDVITHKAGRLSKEGVLKAEEFGKKVMAEATAIGKEFGKHRRVILIEAGLATKATRKESPWNQHQAWFPTILPPSKERELLYSWLFRYLFMTFQRTWHHGKSSKRRTIMTTRTETLTTNPYGRKSDTIGIVWLPALRVYHRASHPVS
jgi:hypothetical protein